MRLQVRRKIVDYRHFTDLVRGQLLAIVQLEHRRAISLESHSQHQALHGHFVARTVGQMADNVLTDQARGRAEPLLTLVDRLPAVPHVAEAQVLEPHRLEPRERHVDLGGLDLVPRIADARLVVDVLGAATAGLGAHLIAAGHPHRLRVRGGALDPRHLLRGVARRDLALRA